MRETWFCNAATARHLEPKLRLWKVDLVVVGDVPDGYATNAEGKRVVVPLRSQAEGPAPGWRYL